MDICKQCNIVSNKPSQESLELQKLTQNHGIIKVG